MKSILEFFSGIKITNFKSAFTLAEAAKPLSHSVNTPKTAFTLAEVLITLGIIGVVAAMTLPTLIQRQQEKATVTSLKKTYSVLSQAYTRAVDEYGPVEDWGLVDYVSPDGANAMMEKITHF